MRVLLVAGALTLLGPLSVRAQDVVVLANGDHLTGELLSVTSDTWTIKYGDVEVKVDAAAVVSFTSERELGVRLADGTIAAGRIALVGDAMRFTSAGGEARTIRPADIAAVGSPDKLAALRPVTIGFLSPFGKFWGMTVGAGFSNTSGNTRSRGFNGDLKVERATAKDRLAIGLGGATQWSGDPATPDSALDKVVEKFYGSGRLDVFLSRAVFVFGGTQQEIDKFQGIDLRSNYGAGAGYQVIATDPTDLRFDLSAGLRVENFTPAAGDSTASVPIASAGGQIRQKLGPVTFGWSLRWTPAVEDVQDYRFLSDASLTTKVFKGLGFRIASRNEYNNNPPTGIKKHDWLITTNLTYTLGQ